jgi:PAS domain S-box-containing protein
VESIEKYKKEKLKNAELRISELEEAFQQTKTGIWEYDTSLGVIKWSPEVYKIYGLSESATPPPLEEIVRFSSKEERDHIQETISLAMINGTPYSVFCEIEDYNGIRKYIRATGAATKDANGMVRRLFGTICDLSEHQEKQKRLLFTEFTIERISEGIYWFDDKLRFFRVNQAAADILGYPKEELIGKRGMDINPSFSLEKSKALWLETKEKGTLTFNTIHRKRNGTEIPVEITNNIINWEGKDFKCSIVRDITERKNQEKRLLEAFDEIEKLKNKLEKQNHYLREEIKIQYNFDEIIADNKQCKLLLKRIEQVSKTPSTVLIMGETGTGKELFARAIHNQSDRSSNTLIKLNCAALPPQLVESELFGHEKGSFTGAINRRIGKFELADKSTLFLDEVGEMPLDIQVKLLRVLQEGEFERVGGNETIKVDVRIIAATNKNLQEAITKKEFREDLYYRLNVFPLNPIPLRQRKSDIPALVSHFLKKFEKRMGKTIDIIPNESMEKLLNYEWPGNIRELENVIERAMITSDRALELEDWIPIQVPESSKGSKFVDKERELIVQTLIKTKGKVSGAGGAAELLEINSKTLESKIRKLKIDKRELHKG